MTQNKISSDSTRVYILNNRSGKEGEALWTLLTQKVALIKAEETWEDFE